MQTKSRRIKRMVLGLQNPKTGGSKRDASRLQFINCEQHEKLEGEYLTAKGQRLLAEGASEEVLSKYKKNRYTPALSGKKKLKVIFHSRVKPIPAAKQDQEAI